MQLLQYMQIMQKMQFYVQYVPELTLVTAVGAFTLPVERANTLLVMGEMLV